MYNKANFAVRKFCAKEEENKSLLTGVHFDGQSTTATDGRILANVTAPTVDPEDFPNVVKGETPLKLGHSSFTINGNACKDIEAAIPTKGALPILGYAALYSIEGDKVKFVTTDLENTKQLTPCKIEGDYLNYKQVIPSDEQKVLTLRLSYAYLKTVAEAFGKFLGKDDPAIDISIYGDDKPVKFEATNGEGQKMTVILMPIKK